MITLKWTKLGLSDNIHKLLVHLPALSDVRLFSARLCVVSTVHYLVACSLLNWCLPVVVVAPS